MPLPLNDTGPQRTLRSARITRTCVLTVTGHRPLTADDWDRHCQVLETMQREMSRDETAANLAFAESGPDAVQRAQVNGVAKLHPQIGAIVSASIMVRGIITALGWTGTRVTSYPPERWRDAFAACGIVDREEIERFGELALQYERELGAQLPALDGVRRDALARAGDGGAPSSTYPRGARG